MINFVVTGTFKAGHSREKFTKNVESQNEKNAREKVYSIFGSKHGIKRSMINIDAVKEA